MFLFIDNNMYNYDSPIPITSDPVQDGGSKVITIFKKILIVASICSIVVILCLICINLNKPLRYELAKYKTNYKQPDIIDLVIIIYTATSHHYRRKMIRDTWLNQNDLAKSNLSIKHFFVIGNRDMTSTKQILLQKEKNYNDIITVPVFDSVRQSSQKLMETFKWLHDEKLVGFKFKFLLKCDDSTYVRIDKLIDALKEIEVPLYTNSINSNSKKDQYGDGYITMNIQSNNLKYGVKSQLELYWGYFDGSSKPSNTEYDWILCDYFPPYAVAHSYVLSYNLIVFLAKNKNVFRYYGREDVSLGVWLGAINNILRVHDRRFNPDSNCQNHFIIQHNLTMYSLGDIHKRIKLTGNMCPYQFFDAPEYNYNWTAPPSQCCLELFR